MEILAWAQKHLQNSMSVKTVCRAIHKCRSKPYHAKKKPYVNMIQKHCHLLWAKAHLKWTEAKWENCSVVKLIKIIFGNLGHCVPWTKEERDQPACYQCSVQKPAFLMTWGCISVYRMVSLHIWKGKINAERYIQVLE